MLKERNVVNLESVHLELWPKSDESVIDLKVHGSMDVTRNIVKKALELRDRSKIPVRQVLNELKINGPLLESDYTDLIKNVVNLKKISCEDGDEISLNLDTHITHELKVEGLSRNLIRHINNFRKKSKLSTKNRINLYLKFQDEILLETFEKFGDKIKNLTQSDKIFINSDKEMEYSSLKIKQYSIQMSIVLL